MANCIYNLAAAIRPDCDAPLVGGATGRAVVFPVDKITSIVQEAANKRVVSDIVGTHFTVEQPVLTPFDGSNTASADNGGVVRFNKTVTFRVPARGAGISKDIIEPLAYNASGYLMILEKKDKVGDGTFEVVGLQSPLKVNGDGVSRNENENGGETSVTMSCSESWFECTFFKTDYATTLAAFNALYNGASND